MEDASRRDEHSKHYRLADGSWMAVISEEPVHFKDTNGEWVDIDATLVPDLATGRVRTRAAEVSASFGPQQTGACPAQVTVNGRAVGLDLLGATEGLAVAEGRTARYRGVAVATDLLYEATGSGVKETLVLASTEAPGTFSFYVDSAGLLVEGDDASGWGLHDPETGERVLQIGGLVVFDSSANELGDPAYCTTATMIVEPAFGGARVTYDVPRGWLDDPARVWPVYVDPTLTAAATQDTYMTSAAPYTAYGSSTELRCGYYDSVTGHNRAYVKFVVSSIPSYARIDSATFSIYQYHTYYVSAATTTYLARVTSSWTESTSWAYRPGQVILASQSVAGRGVWVNWSQTAVKNTVAGWVAGTVANNGLVCYQAEDGSQNTTHWRRFYSSEYAGTTLRPKLVVNYTTAPDPVTDVSASTYSALDWYREVDTDSDGFADGANDTPLRGRGRVQLSWVPTARADGYTIMAWDGDSYQQVGRVLGNATTTWTSEAGGIYPKGSTIAGWMPAARNAFAVAGSPSAPNRTAQVSIEGTASDVGVVVTDGTYLYTRGWNSPRYPGSTSWQRVGTGFNGTEAGGEPVQVGRFFTDQPILSAFYLDGVIYSGYATSPTTITGVPKTASADATDDVILTFTVPLLNLATGSPLTGPSGGVMLASDGERIYSVANDIPGGGSYDGWTIRVYDRAGTWLFDRTVPRSYYTDGVIADGQALYMIEWTASDAARVTKVRTSDFAVVNCWTLDQGYTGDINGCYDAATGSFWLGSLTQSVVHRYDGPGLDLLDDPEALYEKGANAAYMDSHKYWFRVVPFNVAGESATLSSCTPYMPTLENRTVRVNDEDRDTVHEIGEIAGHSLSAVLDEGALQAGVTDLAVASWGPAAELARWYSSETTAPGLLANAPGWRFGFERTIEATSTGAILTDETGTTSAFVLAGGIYQPPGGSYDRLTLEAGGTEWMLAFKDRSYEVYDVATGRLLRVTDKNGNTVTNEWTSGSIRIVAANGKQIVVALDAQGHVSGAVQATADGTREVSYSTTGTPEVTYFPGDADCEYAVAYRYDAGGRLASVTVPEWPTQAEQASWQFGYEPASGRLSTVASPLAVSGDDPHATTTISYEAGTETVDDDASAVVSTGSWVTGTLTSMYADTYRYSYWTGAETSFTFTGTSATWIGSRGSSYGIAEVYVDGVKASTVDTYAETYSHQQALYTASGLSPGTHTLEVRATGTKNLLSEAAVIIVDAFAYTPYPAVEAATVTTYGDVGTAAASLTEDAAIHQHYTMNPTGTMATMTDPHLAGDATHEVWRYTYTPTNEAIVEVAPVGASVSRTLDGRGNVTATFDEEGHRTTYVYDELDQLLRETDPRGCTTYYTYDSGGNLTAEDKQLNTTERSHVAYAYDSAGRVTRQEESIDTSTTAVTEYAEFAPSGEATRIVQKDVVLASGTTGVELVETKSIDAFGNTTEERNAAGEVVSRTAYDLAGRSVVATDAAGVATVTEYDALGNAIASYRRSADGSIIDRATHAYDLASRVATDTYMLDAVVDRTVHHTYDASGREVASDDSRVSTADGDRAVTYYDARGTTVAAWGEGAALGNPTAATRSAYNVYGQLTYEWASGETTATMYAYYPNGLTQKVTAPDGSWTSYTYDDGGLKLTETVPTEADEATTGYTYDIGGRLVSSTTADGATTRYVYDLAGRQVSAGAEEQAASTTTYNTAGWELSSKDSDGIGKAKTYDRAGRVLTDTDAGMVTTTAYDAAGRMATVINPDLAVTTYDYDAFSRTATESAETSQGVNLKTTVTAYDALSRPTTVHVVQGAGASAIERMTTVTYPAGGANQTVLQIAYPGATTTVIYDAGGRETSRSSVTAAGTLQWNATNYDVANRLRAWSFAGAVSGRTYDEVNGRLTGQSGAGFGAEATYSYDAATGRKNAETFDFAYGADEANAYAYNDTGRLVTATVAGATTVYTYQSGSGNLETVKPSTEATRTFAYDAANRVSNVSVAGSVETTYTWDAAGRRIAEGPLTDPDRVTYAYDAAGRLATYSDTAAGVTATYTYDARGQRTQMTVTEGGVTTTSTYTYDGLTLLSVATASSDGTTSSVTYLADSSGRPYGGVYASSESTAVAFGIVTTDRGDVRALTDASGAAFAFYAFDAYGNPRDAQSRATASLDATTSAEVAGANVLRYAGYAFDAHSGLYYCSARYYDPSTASFITKDPAKADGEESAYQYCGGDPVGKVDPSGEWKRKIAFNEKSDRTYFLKVLKTNGGYVHRQLMLFTLAGPVGIVGFWAWLYRSVKPGGQWDFKRAYTTKEANKDKYWISSSKKISVDDFGNIHFGYVFAAAAIHPGIAIVGATLKGWLKNKTREQFECEMENNTWIAYGYALYLKHPAGLSFNRYVAGKKR